MTGTTNSSKGPSSQAGGSDFTGKVAGAEALIIVAGATIKLGL